MHFAFNKPPVGKAFLNIALGENKWSQLNFLVVKL